MNKLYYKMEARERDMKYKFNICQRDGFIDIAV